MLHSQILRKIGTISRIVTCTSDNKFKEYGLKKGQFIFLTRICEHPGINLYELTQMLNVDKSTTTKAVQKLEAAGFITKTHPENNKKNLMLYPTEKAEAVYENVIDEENTAADICFYGFSDEERQEMLNYLERMSTNIEKYREK